MTPLSGQNGSDWSPSQPDGTRPARPFFRADLHVHSRHSGPGHLHGTGLSAGLGDPAVLYDVARMRGMDLVTFTDIDTIDGCLELLERRPDLDDFVISEEVVATDPRTGRSIHVLMYDINEAQHRELQRLKGNVRELMSYARREGIVTSLSPSLRGLTVDGWAREGMDELVMLFDRFEVKNGTLGPSHNRLAERLVQTAAGEKCLGVTAGSNAHGPARIGRAVTVSTARTPREFLGDLRRNRTWASGRDGSLWDDPVDLSRLFAEHYRASLGRRRDRTAARGLAGALLATPLHLLGPSFLRHGLRRARADARARDTWRRLDRMEVRRFQARSESWASALPTAGVEPLSQQEPNEFSATIQHS